MNPRLLIDAIVQQTTVLIAQLSTAAGARSPLAHVADQVFLSLAQEIERQGVGRKVVADMFGLALRTYQRRVQRLEESGTQAGTTLWEAVLEFIAENGPTRRERLIERFRRDDQLAVVAVLKDLVRSGLLYASGRGEATVYGATSEADRKELSGDDADEALGIVLWGTVFRSQGIATKELLVRVRAEEGSVRRALARLEADGRVRRDLDSDDAPLRASPYLIPVGSEIGWEAAVFDHYQAVANGIAAKAREKASGAPPSPHIGGTTLHFGIQPGHPHTDEVLGLLRDTRDRLSLLWEKVAQYNEGHEGPDDIVTRVTFYFGQYLTDTVEPAVPVVDDDEEEDGE